MFKLYYYFQKQIERHGLNGPVLYDETIQRIKWLMIVRLLIVTVIISIGIAILKQPDPRFYIIPLVAIIGSAYVLSAFYLVLFRIGTPINVVMYLQIFFDAALITGIIYFSGGINSQFSLLYFLVILAASIFLQLRGSVIIATIVGLLYGGIVTLEQTQIILPFHPTDLPGQVSSPREFILLKVYLHLCFFYLLAFVSGFLAERELTKARKLEVATEELTRIRFDTGEILRQMSGGVISIDRFGRIMTFNKAAETFFKIREDEIRGKFCAEVFSEIAPQFCEYLLNNMRQGRTDTKDKIEISVKNQQNLPLRISTSILGDSENKRGLIAVFEDLTEEQKMQERINRSEKLAAIGSLAASIAHEIRNPLASISGSVQFLNTQLDLDQENQRLMKLIVKETDRLNTIISDFLMYARLRPATISTVCVNLLVDEVKFLIEKHEKMTPNITLNVTYPTQHLYVSGDENQLRQMLLNLALNSLDAFPEDTTGVISIDLSAAYSDRVNRNMITRDDHSPGSFVRVTISDNGVGIEPKNLPHLFEPFFTTKRRGTGLGLAIVNRIVDNHHGWIDVKSEVGQGTHFYILLPLVLSGDGEKKATNPTPF